MQRPHAFEFAEEGVPATYAISSSFFDSKEASRLIREDSLSRVNHAAFHFRPTAHAQRQVHPDVGLRKLQKDLSALRLRPDPLASEVPMKLFPFTELPGSPTSTKAGGPISYPRCCVEFIYLFTN
jgi:hypothetical protein